MILVENDVIIAKFDSFEERPNGRLINGVIFPMGEVINVVAPEGVEPQKYCYNEIKGFYKNLNYVEYKSPEEKIAALEACNAALEAKIQLTEQQQISISADLQAFMDYILSM